tara:strand:- start:384 stop:614 length:231 start_codon:yes stop_codon:yes gene_type:complete
MSKLITNEGYAPLERRRIQLELKEHESAFDVLLDYDIVLSINDEGTKYTGFEIEHYETEKIVCDFVEFKENKEANS